MNNINPAAEFARENARTFAGTFGEQHHTAPEVALTDPKKKAVDDILRARFGSTVDTGLAAGDGLDLDDVRELMLEAINRHQAENPSVVVIDGEGVANDTSGVEVISLDYLGEWFDDGMSSEDHIERATEDLEQLRAAGLSDITAASSIREYIGQELGADWYDDDVNVIGGRWGDYVIDEGYSNTTEVKVLDVHTGETLATFSTFDAAKAAIDAKLASS